MGIQRGIVRIVTEDQSQTVDVDVIVERNGDVVFTYVSQIVSNSVKSPYICVDEDVTTETSANKLFQRFVMGSFTYTWTTPLTDVDEDSIELPISVAQGGTGATDASTARINLGITPANIGAATSNHNHIISNVDGLQSALDGKAASSHTHNYAGSSSAGGAATSANKLNTNAGSATQPVYFSNGVPVKTTYTLGKSVPSNAVFTDTTYDVATTSSAGLMSAADKVKLDNLEPKPVLNGDDLDDFLEVGTYYCNDIPSDTFVVSNVPSCIEDSTFVLEVLPASGVTGSRIQRITRTAKNYMAVAQRVYYQTEGESALAWGDWDTISINGKRVLWEGVYHMSNSQTATLSDLVSNQESGITLVWSGYSTSGGAAADSNFHFHDVPKFFVRNKEGYGCVFQLASAGFTKVGVKYLYINDDKIVGHATNNQSGTAASGIVYDNAFFVLRYVLGN